MICRKCGTTHDVQYQGEQIWRVGDASAARGIDEAKPKATTQAGVFPICLDPDCLGVLKPEGDK